MSDVRAQADVVRVCALKELNNHRAWYVPFSMKGNRQVEFFDRDAAQFVRRLYRLLQVLQNSLVWIPVRAGWRVPTQGNVVRSNLF